jgi:hypothetical protein
MLELKYIGIAVWFAGGLLGAAVSFSIYMYLREKRKEARKRTIEQFGRTEPPAPTPPKRRAALR